MSEWSLRYDFPGSTKLFHHGFLKKLILSSSGNSKSILSCQTNYRQVMFPVMSDSLQHLCTLMLIQFMLLVLKIEFSVKLLTLWMHLFSDSSSFTCHSLFCLLSRPRWRTLTAIRRHDMVYNSMRLWWEIVKILCLYMYTQNDIHTLQVQGLADL